MYPGIFHTRSLFCFCAALYYSTVQDANTKEALTGATISLENTLLGAISDIKGAFYIADIPLQSVSIRVSLTGYTTKIFRHDFVKGPAVISITLEPDGISLAQVEIKGKAEGQIRAMIEQKRAESIKNIVSAEQIATFPDMNAAEVMQRIPGITLQRDQGEGRFVQLRGTPPELTNFNINGEQIPSPQGGVRYVGMDIIPADQIEFIEVSKVMTPHGRRRHRRLGQYKNKRSGGRKTRYQSNFVGRLQ